MRRNEQRPEFVDVVVAVDHADDIEGRANLLAHTPGQELAVTTNAKDVAELGLQPGERVVVGAELRAPGAVWSRPNALRRTD